MTHIVESVSALVQRIHILQAEQPAGQRLIIAIAGAPGAGKSTIATQICQSLGESAVVVPMDGFHLDNAVLEARQQMAIKGSPPTFDVDGLVVLMQRLARPECSDVYIPVFDRQADLARNAAHCVSARHSVVILEGNYLLLPHDGWQALAPLFHLSVMLDVPLEVLEERLIQRWLDHGLDPEAARLRALSNDIPNARLVTQQSTEAHLYFKSVRQ